LRISRAPDWPINLAEPKDPDIGNVEMENITFDSDASGGRDNLLGEHFSEFLHIKKPTRIDQEVQSGVDALRLEFR
jgi:hypothetical protein